MRLHIRRLQASKVRLNLLTIMIATINDLFLFANSLNNILANLILVLSLYLFVKSLTQRLRFKNIAHLLKSIAKILKNNDIKNFISRDRDTIVCEMNRNVKFNKIVQFETY